MLRSGLLLPVLTRQQSLHHVFLFRQISQRPKKVRYNTAVRTKQEKHNEEINPVEKIIEPIATASKTKLNELQLDEPPVLFIRKYEKFIDTKDIVVRDELSDLEKNGSITPSSLTSDKIKFIHSAVAASQTFKQLKEALKKQPEPLHAPATSVVNQKSVFVDSDFEVIKPDTNTSVNKLSLAKYETELEWSSSRLDLSKLPAHYLMLSKSRLTLLVCLTAGAGYGMAPGDLTMSTALLATIGTAMASASANSINQILEVPFDSQMNRSSVVTNIIWDTLTLIHIGSSDSE